MDSNDLSIDTNLMEVIRNELIQLHCENVSWEKASDKIPLELVRYLLGDLVSYLSTLVFLRGNRCLFLLEWPQTIDSNEAWNYMLANSIGKKTYMEVGHYRFTYMLSHVGPKYEDLVEIYCHAHWPQPDPNFRLEDVWWTRIVGSRNTAAIYIDGIATTALYDSGAEIQLISKEFCEENNLKIHPIEKLTECSTMNGEIFGYEEFVEVNVQIPGRDFSEDHLLLVTSEISHQKEIPDVVGTYFIASLSEYLKTLEKRGI